MLGLSDKESRKAMAPTAIFLTANANRSYSAPDKNGIWMQKEGLI